MVLSRALGKAAFNHVLDVVLDRSDGSQLKNALIEESIEDIFSLTTMTQSMIDLLTYPSKDDQQKTTFLPVKNGDKNLLRCFLNFIVYRNSIENPIDDDWILITSEDFDEFRISPNYLTDYSSSLSTTSIIKKTTNPITSSSTFSPADLFRRGIKRDPSVFPTLKDERFNDQWHRSFVNQARAQDVSEVLDAIYIPSSKFDIDLFDEKQKYVYAILESKVLTDKGKSIVRKYETTYDAQRAYRDLASHHLTSTKAMIDSSTILAYITSCKLGNGEWSGTTEAFIINWQNQVRLYERQVPSSDHFSNLQKKIMLQNAVHGVEELRQVKNTADILKINSGRELSFDQYVNLLHSAAVAHDSQFIAKRGKRQVMEHELYSCNKHSYSDDFNDLYDIDTTIDVIQANATASTSNRNNFRNKSKTNSRPLMSRDKWFSLSQSQKNIWDQLDDHAKSIILGTSSSDHHQMQHNTKFNNKTKINLHDISAFEYIQSNMHELESMKEIEVQDEHEDANQQVAVDNADTILINAASSSGKTSLLPGDIRRVMSKSSTRSVNFNEIEYCVSNHKSISDKSMSLIDRGANGGVAGLDVRVIFKTERSVDIRGIDNHQCTNIDIGTVGGVVETNKGLVIAIMHQYALLNRGNTIHSACQLESFKNDVNDRSIHVKDGLQRIKTLDGYILPLIIKDGLARLKIRPFTDNDWDTLPHIFLTSETDWDPSILDYEYKDIKNLVESSDLEGSISSFNEFGEYRHRINVQYLAYFVRNSGNSIEDIVDQCILKAHSIEKDSNHSITSYTSMVVPLSGNLINNDANLLPSPKQLSKKAPDYDKLRPFFGWMDKDIIKLTFKNTTQYARIPTGTTLKRAFKSPNPAMNVYRRNEPVACDIVYADVSAIDDGSIAAVIFVGVTTQVTDVYGIKTDKQFVNTLEDNIIARGAPHKLISDRAQVIISNKVQDILRTLIIGNWQSEPHQQQQNHAERRYQTVKNATNRILDRTGAPSVTWLLCIKYVCYLLNHTYNENIKNVPLTCLTGTTVDISPLLRFYFWQKVYYKQVDCGFPTDSGEAAGNIVGISEHCGNAMTWKILTCDTNKIIFRSLVRPLTDNDMNLRVKEIDGEDMDINIVVKNRNITNNSNLIDPLVLSSPKLATNMPIIDAEELIGKSFLMKDNLEGTNVSARVVKLIEDHEFQVNENNDYKKFVISTNNDTKEEIITYNDLIEYISKDNSSDIIWKFRKIISHQGPIMPSHNDYKGSNYNVMIEWENGEVTSEPLQIIAADDPVTCAIYARENGLLDVKGWKRFKQIAKKEKSFTRMAHQAKIRSFNTAPKYKYGFEIPRTYDQAIKLDERNKNRKWQEAVDLELLQIDEYETFIDKGHHTKIVAPNGYKKIRVHFVFDVKHDGRHKCRLVADGHLTDIPLESVYSGVVSLRGFRLVVFLAELNKIPLWSTDIGNAYLEAHTSEKVYIIAGQEFNDRAGNLLIINKALYGLRSSGARWHDRLSDCMSLLGFFPCKAEPDIWMRKSDKAYEYIAVYVDDLAIAMNDPSSLINHLENNYKFKLKGSGIIKYHLGMDFKRDDDSTLCISPTKYIEKLVNNYEMLFGELPKQHYSSPLEKGCHPELDTSDLLDNKGITLYQSMIGALQWAVTIGRFDIMTAVMTLSGFRVAPRKGHLEGAKRIYGYLSKMRHSSIRIRTEEPDYSDLPDVTYDWSRSVYGKCVEISPQDAPPPLGNHVTLTHYVDANLMHNVVTGKSVTGVLHLINKTPIEWYSKKQATVETATYGSEFVAARTCVEQIIDLRNTLKYLGIPIRGKSYMFGDNKSVVDSCMQVHSKLHKRHTILSFHRVREAIASGMIGYFFIPGKDNPSDVLSKHWGYSQVWYMLKALLFWKGDTYSIEE